MLLQAKYIIWWRHNILAMMPDNLHNSYTQQFVKWGVFHTNEGLKKEYEQKPSSQHYQNENRVCESRKIHVVHVLLFKYAQKFEIDLSVHFIWFRYFNSEKGVCFGSYKLKQKQREMTRDKKNNGIEWKLHCQNV